MSGGGSNKETTVQSSEPWSAVQPFIKDVLSGAQSAYNSGQGFKYPNFPTTIPFSSQTSQALTGIQGLAGQGNPLGDASQSAALGLLGNGGMNSQMQQAAGYLQPYASGQNVNGGSPEFLKALDIQSGKLADDVQRSVGNQGRTGSAYNTGTLVDQVGGLRTSAISNEIAREQGQQMQGISGLAGLGAQGAANTFGAIGAAPGIYQQQFAPYQQMAGVGAAYDDLATRQKQEDIDRFNMGQQEPWSRLGAYGGLLTGNTQGFGTSTATTTKPQPGLFQQLLGGGLGLLGLLGG